MTIIREIPRLGHCKGYNAAFARATAEWVCWLNDDVEVCEGWASRSLDFMRANPSVGIGALQFKEAGRILDQRWLSMNYASFGVIRRVLGNQLGWFDPELWMYGGDNSLCFKALLVGKGIVPIPEVEIVHLRTRDAHRPANESTQRRDMAILTHKYMRFVPRMQRTHNMVIAQLRGNQ